MTTQSIILAKMLSPSGEQHIKNDKITNKIIQNLICLQVKYEDTQTNYENNLDLLNKLNKQIQKLKQVNQQLMQIQTLVTTIQVSSQAKVKEDEVNKNKITSNLLKQEQDIVKHEWQVKDKGEQSVITTCIPNLSNMEEYFACLGSVEKIGKYMGMELEMLNEREKHMVQVHKLEQKLENVDKKVNQVFNVLKKERKFNF